MLICVIIFLVFVCRIGVCILVIWRMVWFLLIWFCVCCIIGLRISWFISCFWFWFWLVLIWFVLVGLRLLRRLLVLVGFLFLRWRSVILNGLILLVLVWIICWVCMCCGWVGSIIVFMGCMICVRLVVNFWMVVLDFIMNILSRCMIWLWLVYRFCWFDVKGFFGGFFCGD